jgi:hypothetical protein
VGKLYRSSSPLRRGIQQNKGIQVLDMQIIWSLGRSMPQVYDHGPERAIEDYQRQSCMLQLSQKSRKRTSSIKLQSKSPMYRNDQ